MLPPEQNYGGNYPNIGSGWAFLSGTSMAAPHVATVAAYFADKCNLMTPAAIESAVRQSSRAYYADQTGTPANIVWMP